MDEGEVQITMVNVEGIKALPLLEAKFLLRQLEYRNTLISTFIEYAQVLQVSAKEEEVLRLNLELHQNAGLMQALMLRLQLDALELKKGCIVGFNNPDDEDNIDEKEVE